MTININLDLSGATPKIEVVQEDPKEAEAQEAESQEAAGHSNEVKEIEGVQEAAGHRPTRRALIEDYSSLRKSHDFETLAAYSKIIPCVSHTWTGTLGIWRLFRSLGF